MNQGGRRYQCSAQRRVAPGRYGCGGVTAGADYLDEEVLRVCAARLAAMPEQPSVPFEASPLGEQHRALTQDRERLVKAQRNFLRTFARTALALEEPELVSEQVEKMQSQIDSIDAQLVEMGSVNNVVIKPREQLALLEQADDAQRRRVIDILVEEVIVYPIGTGQRRTNMPYPESWEIWFKGGRRPTRPGMVERSARIALASGQDPGGTVVPSSAEVRAWAKAQGYELNPKGRIPKAIRAEYIKTREM